MENYTNKSGQLMRSTKMPKTGILWMARVGGFDVVAYDNDIYLGAFGPDAATMIAGRAMATPDADKRIAWAANRLKICATARELIDRTPEHPLRDALHAASLAEEALLMDWFA